MGKKDKYHGFGDLSPILFQLVHRNPELVTLNENFHKKSELFARVWRAAKAKKDGLLMKDVVQFVSYLRRDLRDGQRPIFVSSKDEEGWLVNLLEQFKQQKAVDPKYKDTRPSTYIDRCCKIILLKAIQSNVDVLKEPSDATLLTKIGQLLDEMGFHVETGKIASYVNTLNWSLKRGRLPSFVDFEDRRHFEGLLDAFKALSSVPSASSTLPLRRSSRKSAKLVRLPPPLPPTRSTHKRPAQSRPPSSSKKSRKAVDHPTEAQEILLMNYLQKTNCDILLGKQSWRAFIEGVRREEDRTIVPKVVRPYLENLKERCLIGPEVPYFSDAYKDEGNQVFAALHYLYQRAEMNGKNEKIEVAVGRFILNKFHKVPELLEHQLDDDALSANEYLPEFVAEVSRLSKRPVSFEEIHEKIEQWKTDFHRDNLPSFILSNKKYVKKIEKIAGDHDANRYARQNSAPPGDGGYPTDGSSASRPRCPFDDRTCEGLFYPKREIKTEPCQELDVKPVLPLVPRVVVKMEVEEDYKPDSEMSTMPSSLGLGGDTDFDSDAAGSQQSVLSCPSPRFFRRQHTPQHVAGSNGQQFDEDSDGASVENDDGQYDPFDDLFRASTGIDPQHAPATDTSPSG